MDAITSLYIKNELRLCAHLKMYAVMYESGCVNFVSFLHPQNGENEKSESIEYKN